VRSICKVARRLIGDISSSIDCLQNLRGTRRNLPKKWSSGWRNRVFFSVVEVFIFASCVYPLSIDDQGVSCSCLGTVAHLLMSGASRWFAGPQEAMQVGHGEVGPAPNEDRNRDEYVEVALTDTHETYHAAPPFTIGWMPHVMPSNRRAKTFLHHGATPPLSPRGEKGSAAAAGGQRVFC